MVLSRINKYVTMLYSVIGFMPIFLFMKMSWVGLNLSFGFICLFFLFFFIFFIFELFFRFPAHFSHKFNLRFVFICVALSWYPFVQIQFYNRIIPIRYPYITELSIFSLVIVFFQTPN